ncbi:MAG TPA: glycosyltransferase, partial [Cyanobacteria bacterium UBA11049]|nr:glycosyltransferase [Cyanobacteria bacterium UBA11049]
GSEDGTAAIAASAGVRLVLCDRSGRAMQMNRGARVATGEVLCFLHADTSIPDDIVAVIEQT